MHDFVKKGFHQLERLWVGELSGDPLRCFRATSAASSFALLTYCPSYQYRAAMFWPWMVTVLDHAVRPPVGTVSELKSGEDFRRGWGLTTSIGHDLEDRRVDLGLAALF